MSPQQWTYTFHPRPSDVMYAVTDGEHVVQQKQQQPPEAQHPQCVKYGCCSRQAAQETRGKKKKNHKSDVFPPHSPSPRVWPWEFSWKNLTEYCANKQEGVKVPAKKSFLETTHHSTWEESGDQRGEELGQGLQDRMQTLQWIWLAWPGSSSSCRPTSASLCSTQQVLRTMSEAVRGFGTGSRAKWNSSTPTSRQTSHQMVAGAGFPWFPSHQGMQGGGNNGGVERGEVSQGVKAIRCISRWLQRLNKERKRRRRKTNWFTVFSSRSGPADGRQWC